MRKSNPVRIGWTARVRPAGGRGSWSSVPVLALALGLFACVDPAQAGARKVTFASEDGLPISADLYLAHEEPATPFIVLFHQAGWSRGEYREIAPRLNALGFNCLAVDQRSGEAVNDVENETAKRATEQGLDTSYLAALPDLRAALRHARERYAKGPLLAWGSSYSAALVLRLAGDEPARVDGVVAFAPGEYFERFGKPGSWVRDGASRVQAPVFITSARDEEPRWKAIYAAIRSEAKTAYVPETEGNHGSRALWKQFPDSPGYWRALETFLAEHFARGG